MGILKNILILAGIFILFTCHHFLMEFIKNQNDKKKREEYFNNYALCYLLIFIFFLKLSIFISALIVFLVGFIQGCCDEHKRIEGIKYKYGFCLLVLIILWDMDIINTQLKLN